LISFHRKVKDAQGHELQITEHNKDSRILLTDGDFFKVFPLKILSGESGDALDRPNTIFLTAPLARRLFGEEDPIGQEISLNFIDAVKVAGIIEEPPSNSHIQYQALLSIASRFSSTWFDSWENLSLFGYIRLKEGANRGEVAKKLKVFARKNKFNFRIEPQIQPLLDIHFGSNGYLYDFLNYGKSDTLVIYIMGAVGILILFIVSINFINLSSARFIKRAREVGLRKAVGASRGQLVFQFLCESLITCIAAFFLALGIIQFILPKLQPLLKKELSINVLQNPLLFLICLGGAILIGILSGIFPALIFSRLEPAVIFKGRINTKKSGLILRRLMVVMQFAVTIAVIFGVIIVINQIRFLQSLNGKYAWEHIQIFPQRINYQDSFDKEIAGTRGIISLGWTDTLPGFEYTSMDLEVEGNTGIMAFPVVSFQVDRCFFQTLDLPFICGESFSQEVSQGNDEEIIVNEMLAKKCSWDKDNVIGRHLCLYMEDGAKHTFRVVGIVKDFVYFSTRNEIEPMIFLHRPQDTHFLFIRLDPSLARQASQEILEKYRSRYPNQNAFLYYLNERFNAQFDQDRNFARLMVVLALIALIIACLGLSGLTAYSIGHRQLEMIVRKVYGCSEGGIIRLLSQDLLSWVVLANLVALPGGFYAVKMWLRSFAFQVPLTLWPFLWTVAGSLAIAFLTLFYQVVKLALTPPADVLRR